MIATIIGVLLFAEVINRRVNDVSLIEVFFEHLGLLVRFLFICLLETLDLLILLIWRGIVLIAGSLGPGFRWFMRELSDAWYGKVTVRERDGRQSYQGVDAESEEAQVKPTDCRTGMFKEDISFWLSRRPPPPPPPRPPPPPPPPPPPNPYEAALMELGLSAVFTEPEFVAAYRRAIRTAHPDAGGSTVRAQRVNSARDLIRARRGWKH